MNSVWRGRLSSILSALYGVNLGAYTQQALQYEAFVRGQYLQIPDGTLAYLQQVIAQQGFQANDPAILYKVARFVQTAAAYNLEYSTALDSEEDVVISFLRDYKEGVCRHYAMTATMLFRALGFPARYVTGFMIDAKANEWTQETVGHAWVEVYLSGYGWVQVEVTGGNGSGSGSGNGSGNGAMDDFINGSDNNEQQTQVLKLKPATVAVQYNGSNSATPNNRLASFALKDKGYTYEMIATGERTELGKGESTIVTLCIYNRGGELIYRYDNGEVLLNTENLEIVLQKGVLHLYISKLVFTSYSYSKVYDGTLLRSAGEWEWSGLLEEGHYLDGVQFTSGGLLNVGSMDNTFTVSLKDANGNDINDWYLIERHVGSLTVLPREITVTAGTKAFNYIDGTQVFTCDTYEVTSLQKPEQPLAEGNTVELQMTENSRISDYGFVSNEIDVTTLVIKDAAGKDVTANYTIQTETGP